MLIKSELKNLADKKEYVKVFNYFHDEYTSMLHDFLERHEVEIKEDDCLIDYIVKTRLFMPKYTSYTLHITRAMYNEDVPEDVKYNLLMGSYKTVRDAFSK